MRAIDVPTLLVIGDKPVVTLEMAHELQSINPLVSIEQIADAGHGLPFDQPERLAQVLRGFLLDG
ncbi:MAG: alpha/beta hydrolase [Polyangiaceae bacterium]